MGILIILKSAMKNLNLSPELLETIVDQATNGNEAVRMVK